MELGGGFYLSQILKGGFNSMSVVVCSLIRALPHLGDVRSDSSRNALISVSCLLQSRTFSISYSNLCSVFRKFLFRSFGLHPKLIFVHFPTGFRFY